MFKTNYKQMSHNVNKQLIVNMHMPKMVAVFLLPVKLEMQPIKQKVCHLTRSKQTADCMWLEVQQLISCYTGSALADFLLN